MAEELLPISDTLKEVENRLSVELIKPNLEKVKHKFAAWLLNIKTAAAGQIGLDSGTTKPDKKSTVHKWVNGEYGPFYFVQDIKINN